MLAINWYKSRPGLLPGQFGLYGSLASCRFSRLAADMLSEREVLHA
jgi:hypothetical protein